MVSSAHHLCWELGVLFLGLFPSFVTLQFQILLTASLTAFQGTAFYIFHNQTTVEQTSSSTSVSSGCCSASLRVRSGQGRQVQKLPLTSAGAVSTAWPSRHWLRRAEPRPPGLPKSSLHPPPAGGRAAGAHLGQPAQASSFLLQHFHGCGGTGGCVNSADRKSL